MIGVRGSPERRIFSRVREGGGSVTRIFFVFVCLLLFRRVFEHFEMLLIGCRWDFVRNSICVGFVLLNAIGSWKLESEISANNVCDL